MPSEPARRRPGARERAAAGSEATPPRPAPALPAPPPLQGALRLAYGELSPQEHDELSRLKATIERLSGFGCASYKERCFRRRIGVRMRAHALVSYSAYAELLEREPAERDRLLAALTINVSKFFRNPEVWQAVRGELLPELFAAGRPRARAWSAGCACGEEPYSLAILARELESAGAKTTPLEIVGTDVDAAALGSARAGVYPASAFTDTEPSVRDRWFSAQEEGFLLDEGIRSAVRFEAGDLLVMTFPRNLDLIICRNVLIYLERAVQQKLLRGFHDALAPGGFLLLGKVEMLPGDVAPLLRTVSARARIYRKP